MPVYNPHPVYFRQAIESILNQTLQDWELVIVEDPSPRSSAEILKNYPDPRIRHFVRSQRTSLGDAINFGLYESRSDLVAIAFADDINEPERLEKEVSFLDTSPEITLVGSQLALIDEGNHIVGFRHYPCDHETIVRTLRCFNSIAHPSVVYRKKSVLDVGGYRSIDLVEDYDLWCRLAKHGAKFASLPNVLVQYRVHTESLSKGTKTREVIRATIEIKRLYWSREMDAKARLRLLAEHLLLLLPPRFVVWLFLKTQIKKTL